MEIKINFCLHIFFQKMVILILNNFQILTNFKKIVVKMKRSFKNYIKVQKLNKKKKKLKFFKTHSSFFKIMKIHNFTDLKNNSWSNLYC